MESKQFSLALLSCLVLLAQATPEDDLRSAITSPGPATYILNSNILLTRDLPPLADRKVLTVQSAIIDGAPFKIDGQRKYNLFRNEASSMIVTLTLNNLILTRSKNAAVELGGEDFINGGFTTLSVNRVDFVKNSVGIKLGTIRAGIANSLFIGHTKGAIVISDSSIHGGVGITGCSFLKNKAQSGRGGGAIHADIYSLTADKCYFYKNTADTAGGAVWMSVDYAEMIGSTFDSNKAKEGGGAIAVSSKTFGAHLEVKNSVFQKNVAERLEGGAVRLIGTDRDAAVARFRNVLFRNNKALKKLGGAFSISGVSEAQFCRSRFVQNTGAKNVASNGYVSGTPVLGTEPGVAIPALAIAPGAKASYKNASCT